VTGRSGGAPSEGEHEAIVLTGGPLAAGEVAAVARRRVPVRMEEAARERNRRAREQIAELLAAGAPLYGASTGVGALRDLPVSERERGQLQWRLLRSHAVGAGPPLSPELVRAGMLVRANQLGAGGGGVLPELLERLIAALNDDAIPVVHSLASLGTGDLSELAEVALALLGEAPLYRSGGGEDGLEAGARAAAAPVRLELRDAISFMSSGAFTLGRAALACVDAAAAMHRWSAVAALSFEAADADPIVLDERIALARGSEAQARVAERLRSLLEGSSRGPGPHPVQDPYPFRVLPQIDAVPEAALQRLTGLVERETAARAENALILDGLALPNGNFHAAELAASLDALRSALAQSAALIAARISSLLDPRISGLPPFLAQRPGLDSGAMMLEYLAGAACAELRSLVLPVTAQSAAVSLGVESHASLAPTSLARTEQALGALEPLVATELVVAVRALRISGREPRGRGTGPLFHRAAAELPAELADRPLGGDVRTAMRILSELHP
jgi:histidine ammonia-lyase